MEGKEEMTHNYALEKEQVDAGFILTCQSHPTTDVVVVDFEGSDEWLRGPDVVGIKESNGTTEVLLADGADHQEILKRGLQSDANIFRFELMEPRLHDIFVRHVGADTMGDVTIPESGLSVTP